MISQRQATRRGIMSNQKRAVIYNFRFGAVCALFAMLCVNKLPAAPQPLVFYDFEEGSGNTVINQGTMSGDGMIMNTADWISGTPGSNDGGYRFNGLTGAANLNYIETGFTAGELGVYHATEVRPFTMACWLQGGREASFEIVFGQPLAGGSRPMHIGLRDAEPHFGLHDDDLHYSSKLPTGTWHHLTFVLSADNIQRVFVDGKFCQARLAERTGIFNDAPIILGAMRNDYINSPDGAVDDVVIYNEELSFSQIQFLVAGGSPTNLPERIAGDDGRLVYRTYRRKQHLESLSCLRTHLRCAGILVGCASDCDEYDF